MYIYIYIYIIDFYSVDKLVKVLPKHDRMLINFT